MNLPKVSCKKCDVDSASRVSQALPELRGETGAQTMNATTLRDRIMELIAALWEKAENKEAHLSVAQLRELEN